MKIRFQFSFLTSIIILSALHANAQISNYIYSITNPSSGVFYFSKIEIATGIMTDLQLMPFTSVSVNSSCIDNQSQKYYFCTGTNLLTIDPVNGNILSADTLPVSPTASFQQIAFNPCDSHIYGLITDFPSVSFVKYELSSGTMTTISPLSGNPGFSGGLSFIDPDSGIYVFENAFINGLDLATGQVLYSSLINDLPNENFGHIALKCNTHQVFGTSADATAGVKYLSTIDPYTGNVTHVSNTGWNVGIWKPLGGGARIDQSSGIFYYSGAGSLLVGANTITGNMIFNQTVAPGSELRFIEHFSECTCTSTGINSEIKSSEKLTVLPNPFNNKLNITDVSGENAHTEIILYDIFLRKLLHHVFTNSVSLNTEQLAQGIYIYEVKTRNGIVKKGKVVKPACR